jgi:response regulator RpfG family c-di-GMP phosphodiesterase
MQYKVLVVDDEPANLRMVERLLRKDYQVMTAISGEEALEILSREAVDLIITDQRMPGMSGTDLLRESMQTSPDATRIILTGYTDIESLIEAINTSRVYKYVSKPWDPINLKVIVDQALNEHQKQVDMKEFVNDIARIMHSHPTLFTEDSKGSAEPVGKSVSSAQQ